MIRGSLVSIIYRKTLRLHLNEAKSSAALTLASSDVDRIGLTVESGHEIWASSIETILALVLLQRQLGWASIAPVLLALRTPEVHSISHVSLTNSSTQWLPPQIRGLQSMSHGANGNGAQRSRSV
jgi:hypothetical protein